MATENTQQATEQQPQLPLNGEQQQSGESLEPTTVTIEAEGEAQPQKQEGGDQSTGQSDADRQADEDVSIDAAPTSDQPQRRKNHVPSKQRISQLTAQRKEAEERAAYWENEAKKYYSSTQTLHQKNQQTEQQSMRLWAESLKAKQASARQAMIEAKNSGDAMAEAKAIEDLASHTSDLRSAEAYLQRNPQQQPQQNQQPQRQGQPQQSQQPAFTPEVQAWMKDNSWYDRSSPDFDADMSQFAHGVAQQVEARLRRQGRAAEIGKASYLAEIDQVVRKEFPDMFEDEPAQSRQPLRMQANGPNAAVSHNGAVQNGIRRNGNQINVALSAEEREFARNMQKKHESGPKAGQAWSDAEKEAHYARIKYDQSRGKNIGGVEINMRVK